MDCSCTGIGGLEASLKLNYVLVVPGQQSAMFRDELLARGVPERQIYEVNPNRRPPSHCNTTSGRLAAAGTVKGGGGGDRNNKPSSGRPKRFMPGAIKLGTYVADGRRYNVCLRWGSVWISAVDPTPAEALPDGGPGSSVADGGGASEVPAPMAVPDENGGGGGRDGAVGVPARVPPPTDADAQSTTGRGDDCDDGGDLDDCDDVYPNPVGNDGGRCNSSSTLCDECKRWLLSEYFGDRRRRDKASGRHACVYKRIVDRLFVVTVTESGAGQNGDGDEDDDDDGPFDCETTVGADQATSEVADPAERDLQPVDGQTAPAAAQPAPETEPATATTAAPEPAANVDKPKSKSFFSKLCGKKSNKKKKNVEPPKTD
ncbi:unnamed protein product [Aphis gossypii]|uniref:Uncharacterized protein n=1 Tax=Aphis gossypii TaxID=80765 RepID=A0A9P0NM56_APHGO|nr:unnamed protein product [Aphis gossypii]